MRDGKREKHLNVGGGGGVDTEKVSGSEGEKGGKHFTVFSFHLNYFIF